MLRYKDKSGKVSPLTEYKDLYIEEVLDYGDKTLGFSVSQGIVDNIELEDYIVTKTDEYVIKQINDSDNNFYDIVAKLNVDALEGNALQKFETVEQTALNTANLALAGTGWICECDIKKKRTIRMTNSSSWDVLKKIADTFRFEMTIDSLNKKIIYKEKVGEDKGCYFSDQLNLVSLSSQSDTTNFYTRILPLGKDGLTIESVNNGSKFLENYIYSDKSKTYIWKDERYTIPESLKEDAEAKLQELSSPYIAYSCKLIDLDGVCGVGDTITLINKHKHTRIKQRIVKIKRYPDNPSNDTCEISNLKLSFSSYVQKYNNTSDTVDNITNDNGTVDGDCIDNIDASKVLNIDTIIANNAEFINTKTKILEVEKSMTAAEAKIGTLETTSLKATDAELKYANIDFTNIGKAAMEYFYAQSGLIKNVVVGDQTITGELIGVTIKGDLIEGNTIVADKLVIKGNDGLYYKLNTDGMHVEAEQTEYNSLNGSIIQAKSITATKIAVDDLVAFDATIAGFKITDEAIYSGAKSSALNNTRGIYLGKDGQLAFGDGNNYLKFYKDVSGNFKLAISASSMTFSSTGASVEDVIEDINDKVDSVVSVEKSDVTYQVGNSGTQKPSGEWTKSMPKANAGQFLWTRTLITYSDGSVTELFSVSLMGEKGDKGDKGDTGADAINVSITSSAGTVFKNNSGTTILTAHIYEGSEELTVVANGKCKLGLVKWYKGTTLISVAGAVNVSAADVTNTQLYTCQLVDNGDVKASSQISIVDITDAYSVLLTSEAYTFAGNTSGAPAGQTCTTQIVAFCGQKSCTASVGNISCPTGITATITNNNTIAPIITFRTTANITASCEATIPVTIDKATINKKFSFAVAKSGANGTNGTNGNDGISSWTPVLTNVTRNGATFVKNNVGNGWGNAAFHSKEGYIDGCYVSCRSVYGSNFISLNADPATDAWYTGLDYAWYMNSGTASVWINGKPIYNPGTYNEHTIFKIVYDGSTVKFYMDNTLHYSLARAKGVPLYADNSFYHNNARLEDVVFGPCGAKGDTGASGNGIASTAVAYQAGSSGVTVPTGTWQASPPATSAAAPYMWTRITITYTNGTVTNSYSVGSTPEGISVGGRNLIIGSSKWTKDNPAKSTAAADGYVYIGGSALLEQGKTYTLQAVSDSIWSTSHNSATGTATIWLHGLNDGFHRVFTGDGKTNGRYIWTFTHTYPTQNCDIRINGYSKVTNFWNIKIESGNKATDWTPAPEDVDAKFNNYTTTEQLKADFKNTNSEFYSAISSSFATKVQLSKVDGKFSDYYSREDASTAIKQINNAISLKASLEEFHNGYRIIEAGGYGNDYRGTGAWLKINNIKQNIATGRGLSVTSINPTTLVANGSWSYDTFGSATARTNFKNKITELNSGDYIIVVVSSDAAYPSTVADALQLIGGTVYTGESYREAYALIGKSRLGYGNGIEMYIPKTAEDKRNAVVSCYVSTAGALMSSNSNSLYKKVTADLELKVGKNDNNQIVSMINASANEINLKANRFSLESDNLIITKDGKITKCKSINVTGGNIGRWNISDYLSSDNKDSDGYIRRAWMQPAANDETWVYSVQKSSNKNDASAFGGLWFVKGNGDQTTQNLNVNKNLTVYSDLTLYGKLTTDLKFRNYGKIINPYNQDLRFYASSEEQYALTFGVEYSASHSVITGWHFGPDAGGHIELGSARHPWYSIHADTSLYVHSGSVYCYDYYYIWSNGGWVELSDWIKAKL